MLVYQRVISMGQKNDDFLWLFPSIAVRSTEPTPSASSRCSFDVSVAGRHGTPFPVDGKGPWCGSNLQIINGMNWNDLDPPILVMKIKSNYIYIYISIHFVWMHLGQWLMGVASNLNSLVLFSLIILFCEFQFAEVTEGSFPTRSTTWDSCIA